MRAPNSTDKVDSQPLFSTAVWRQRRSYACQSLEDAGAKTILDIGCGEGSLLQILLNDTRYSHIAGIDIDAESLLLARDSCQPSRDDFFHLRELPITLELYRGSFSEVDDRLKGYEAITCLEVIEHLNPDMLAKIPEILFGIYQPRLVIISTPNAEFNVHFDDLKYGTSKSTFRHWDHKFEWTRAEFETWYGFLYKGLRMSLLDTDIQFCSTVLGSWLTNLANTDSAHRYISSHTSLQSSPASIPDQAFQPNTK